MCSAKPKKKVRPLQTTSLNIRSFALLEQKDVHRLISLAGYLPRYCETCCIVTRSGLRLLCLRFLRICVNRCEPSNPRQAENWHLPEQQTMRPNCPSLMRTLRPNSLSLNVTTAPWSAYPEATSGEPDS